MGRDHVGDTIKNEYLTTLKKEERRGRVTETETGSLQVGRKVEWTSVRSILKVY